MTIVLHRHCGLWAGPLVRARPVSGQGASATKATLKTTFLETCFSDSALFFLRAGGKRKYHS